MRRLSSLLVPFVLILGFAACNSAEVVPEGPPVTFDCPVPEHEREYLHELLVALEYVGEAFGELAELFRQTRTNPELMLDEEWKWGLGDWLIRLVEEATIIRNLQPPESVSYIQARALLLAADLDTAATEIAEGIDHLDQGRIDNGVFAFVTLEGHLNKTYRNVDGYCERARNDLPLALRVPE